LDLDDREILWYKAAMLWLFRIIPVLFLYTGMVIYTGFRFFAFGRFLRPSLKALIFWPLYGILAYHFVFLALFRLDRIKLLRLAGMYWLPFFVYLFSLILLLDLISCVLSQIRKKRRNPLQQNCTVRIMPAGAGAALVLTLIVLLYGSIHAQDIRTVRYELSIPGKTGMESFRIILVSDLHIGPTVGKAWTARIVDLINDASPDMVCIPGDIFESGLEGMVDQEEIAAELRRINAPLGVYACPGNHDTDRRTRSTGAIARFLAQTGIIFLQDEVAHLPGTGIFVAGRKDPRPIGLQDPRLSMEEFAASIDGTIRDSEIGNGPDKPLVILLDHQPLELGQAAEAGIDLVLCGHTHRGQFFPADFITRLMFRGYGGTNYGLWRKNNTQAVVTSGAGVWGPPVRIGTNSEIAVLDLWF